MADTRRANPPRGWRRRMTALVATHVAETGMLLLSWICLGHGALSGRLDRGWMVAWALSLASMLPLRSLSTWLQGDVVLYIGARMKQRLLAADLLDGQTRPAERGLAQRLSESLETAGVDDLAACGGVDPLLAGIELAAVPLLMVVGGVSPAQIAASIAWGCLTLGALAQNLRLRADWTQWRLNLSANLVGDLVAYRTRSVQPDTAQPHGVDDALLAGYLRASRALDASTVRIEAVIPRAYLITAVSALAVNFADGTTPLDELAITLGVVLFARAALERLCFGFSRPATAWTAWRLNSRAVATGAAAGPAVEVETAGALVLRARDLGFTYPGRPRPVLSKCSLTLDRGDRVLVEGSAGSGKSTLAAILAGAEAATTGYVLAGGLDRSELGAAAWRRRVALVPAYHDNHIFCAPLAFNLLLARELPYAADDLREAQAVCEELGLGELLARMPAGIHESVGESSWRLSQGEKSRIFLARALLQRADVVILDEILSALDPENLKVCLDCVRRRAPTLLVMASADRDG